ncbi:hypothetical protein [Pseudonocardia sp. ICBG1293]|nr:hypothetical protein [Pseudonocardia sp. ICBG1293]
MVAPRVSEKTKIFELEIVLTEVVPAAARSPVRRRWTGANRV